MRERPRDYPSFPDIEAQLGYNPARFLDRRVGKNGETQELTAKALIRGVQTVEDLRLWINVEAELGRGRNGGPRKEVARWVGTRQVELQQQEREENVESEVEEPTEEIEDKSELAEIEDESENHRCPTTATASGDTNGADVQQAMADGGTPDPDTPPRCPDCHGELPEDTVDGDEAAWCAYCGGLKPLGGSA